MEKGQRTILIGRDRNCDIALGHDTVSARHAELTFLDDGKLLVTDRKSRNGTYRVLPDGRALALHHELVSPMDTLRLGEVTISVRELLEALRLKFPNFDTVPRPPAPPDPAPRVQGHYLERCVCGRIKPAGKPCPGCGQ